MILVITTGFVVLFGMIYLLKDDVIDTYKILKSLKQRK